MEMTTMVRDHDIKAENHFQQKLWHYFGFQFKTWTKTWLDMVTCYITANRLWKHICSDFF